MRIGWLLCLATFVSQQNVVTETLAPRAPKVEFWLSKAYHKDLPPLQWLRKPTPENGDTVTLHFVVLPERPGCPWSRGRSSSMSIPRQFPNGR